MNRLLAHGYRWLDFFVEKPSRGLLLICGLQMVGWGILVTFFMPIPYYDILLHTFFASDPDADFGGEDYRNPPLAYWLTHWLNFGEPLLVYPHNIAAQIFVIATYTGVYYMGLALLKNKRDALVAVLLLIPLGVYQGAPSSEFSHGYLQGLNHNVLQYPFWVLIPLATFYAARPLSEKAHQHWFWLVLGVLLGMGCWTKISIGLLYSTLLVWTLIDREARQHYKTAYPYLAIGLCLLIGAMPIYYGLYHWADTAHYVFRRASRLLVFDHPIDIVVILASMVGVAIVARGISLRTSLCYPFARMTRRASHFLLFITFMPFAIILVGLVYWQIFPYFSWTQPMYALLGIVLVAIMRSTWHTYTPHVILLAAIVLLLKPVYYYPLVNGFYPRTDNHWVIAEKITDEWNKQTQNTPIGIVYGSVILGGLVSLYNSAATLKHSVRDNDLHRGVLFVFHDYDWAKNPIRETIKRLQVPEQTMKIDEYPHVIYYAILPPTEK